MSKANRSLQHKARLNPEISLDALDETAEMIQGVSSDLNDAGALALSLRESASKLLKLSSMNVIQQASHAPVLMADVCGQIAYALELIELSKHE